MGHANGAKKPKKVLIWVESLQGAGHMHAADKIATALANEGIEVHIATSSHWRAPDLKYGGAHIHHYDEKLGIVFAGKEKGYRTKENVPLKDAKQWRALRFQALMDIYHKVEPDAIITEHWPFARGNLDFEIHRAVEEIKKQKPDLPIFGSCRDIMHAYSPPAGECPHIAASIINTHFDVQFVHGDETLVPITRSVPAATSIADKIMHTGYMVHPLAERDSTMLDIDRPVLVSAGGGATQEGFELYKTAIQARKLLPHTTGLHNRIWKILVSPAYSEAQVEELRQLAFREGPGIEIYSNPKSSDYRAMLKDAAFSISLAGYNTMAELYAANIPAVVTPYGNQIHRAHEFSMLGKIEILYPEYLNKPAKLASVIEFACCKRTTLLHPLKLEGEKVLAREIAERLNMREHPAEPVTPDVPKRKPRPILPYSI